MKGNHKDLSKIKCFNYREMDQFSTRCLMKKKGYDEKKKGNQVTCVATSVEIDGLFRRLDKEDFTLFSHFPYGTIDDVAWYVDSDVLNHMIGS